MRTGACATLSDELAGGFEPVGMQRADCYADLERILYSEGCAILQQSLHTSKPCNETSVGAEP